MIGSHQDMLTKLVPNLVQSLPHPCREYIRQSLQHLITVPLTLFWVAPIDGMLQWDGERIEEILGGDELQEGFQKQRSMIPIVLLSCSDEITETDHSSIHSWYYIKGAGDDEENWSSGLTSEMFWKYQERILCSDDPSLVEKAVKEVILEEQTLSPALFSKTEEMISDGSDVDDGVGAGGVDEGHLKECRITLHSLKACLSYLTKTPSRSFNQQDSESLSSQPPPVHGIILLLTPSEHEQFMNSPLAASLVFKQKDEEGVGVQLLPLLYKSGKKNHNKNNFIDELFPAVLAFYHSLLQTTSQRLPTLWIARTAIHITGIDIAILTCLLLCFFDLHFHLLSPPIAPALTTSVLPSSLSLPEVAKADILLMAGALQSTLPRCILHRAHVKELTRFFEMRDMHLRGGRDVSKQKNDEKEEEPWEQRKVVCLN
jgi:hypothetical protein